MKKTMLVLGMVVATIMVCGSYKNNEITKAEIIENQIDDFGSEEAYFVHNFYPAVECILGEEVRHQEVKYSDNGFIIDDRFISYDEIDKHVAECDGDYCV